MKKITLTAALLAASFLTSAAQAQDGKYYVGVGHEYGDKSTNLTKLLPSENKNITIEFVPLHLITLDVGYQLDEVIRFGAKLNTNVYGKTDVTNDEHAKVGNFVNFIPYAKFNIYKTENVDFYTGFQIQNAFGNIREVGDITYSMNGPDLLLGITGKFGNVMVDVENPIKFAFVKGSEKYTGYIFNPKITARISV